MADQEYIGQETSSDLALRIIDCRRLLSFDAGHLGRMWA
jgi:hypothetical protein